MVADSKIKMENMSYKEHTFHKQEGPISMDDAKKFAESIDKNLPTV